MMRGEIKAISKQRPRTGRSGHFFTPKRTRDFERAIREMAEVFLVRDPVTFPVMLDVKITHAVPKSWKGDQRAFALGGWIYPKRGDLDNKVKAISDALNGLVFIDDVQIVDLHAQMRYGGAELVEVTVARAGYTLEEMRRLNEEDNSSGA